MKDAWNNTVITEIGFAVHVLPNSGRHVHKNRPLHGFVLNDSESVKDYCFDDGRVLNTKGNSLFYLPKGSSYHVQTLHAGGCYAINFDADISDVPFSVELRNAESALNSFQAATEAWKRKDDSCKALAMRAVYDAIYRIRKEETRQYVSGTQAGVIAPAISVINDRFTENELSISELAALCSVSEVYFRRLFLNLFGVSPKEYVIQKRIEYAKALLLSGNFSVSETALMCGYAEPCHFSREFSKRTGRTPSQYIRS